ncbi:hypothetical protein OH807_35375 [Kitasatospora sp. NBC_01560]|uniref:hypothetical protein n=1 Tax=Kitasatospora sp. NBC_01560 TaxID=2975965 RepID=UPI003869081C
MNVQQTLAAFGATAAIGPLRCGESLNDVVAALGAPWDIGRVSERRRWPHLFSYGDVEICVCRCRRITMMCLQAWRDTIALPAPGSATIASHPGGLTLAHVTDALDAIDCRYRPVTLHQPPGQMALEAATTGVAFTFRTDVEAQPLLDTAGSWTTTHTCAPLPSDLPDDGLGAP